MSKFGEFSKKYGTLGEADLEQAEELLDELFDIAAEMEVELREALAKIATLKDDLAAEVQANYEDRNAVPIDEIEDLLNIVKGESFISDTSRYLAAEAVQRWHDNW